MRFGLIVRELLEAFSGLHPGRTERVPGRMVAGWWMVSAALLAVAAWWFRDGDVPGGTGSAVVFAWIVVGTGVTLTVLWAKGRRRDRARVGRWRR